MAAAAGAVDTDPATALGVAERSYDLQEAQRIRDALLEADPAPSDPSARLLRVKACLLVAELERLDFEETPRDDGPTRRTIGDRIDESARQGLDLLKDLEEASEELRLRADLLGTLIRSKFRGKKYRSRMERAARTAIELDPENARAYVSASKPYLLRPGRDEKDLVEGLDLVEQALEQDPTLEPALLLRGRAHYELGDRDAAHRDWERALELNPDCRPAATWLEDYQP